MVRGFIILSFLFSLLTVKSLGQEKPKKINYVKEGYVKAKVVHYVVDDCGFLIQLPDKAQSKLVPDTLPLNLKKHGKKVWIKYTLPKKQLMSTCMTGKQIEVIDIRKR